MFQELSYMLKNKLKIVLWKTPTNLLQIFPGYEFSSKEIEILKLGLHHGVAIPPVEPEMIVALEDIWDQIKNVKVIKNDLLGQRIKTFYI